MSKPKCLTSQGGGGERYPRNACGKEPQKGRCWSWHKLTSNSLVDCGIQETNLEDAWTGSPVDGIFLDKKTTQLTPSPGRAFDLVEGTTGQWLSPSSFLKTAWGQRFTLLGFVQANQFWKVFVPGVLSKSNFLLIPFLHHKMIQDVLKWNSTKLMRWKFSAFFGGCQQSTVSPHGSSKVKGLRL